MSIGGLAGIQVGANIASVLPAQPNQSLIDGLSLLQSLATAEGAVGSRELARASGMEPTRVNRLLKTLAYLGLAEQTPDRRYRPGAGMHVLSAQALHASGLIRRAIAPLESLHRFGHLVALGVLWRTHTCYLYHATPGMNAALAIGRAGLYPATQSGIGMALLAQLDEPALRARYGDGPIAGFSGMDDLLGELERVRAQGFACVPITPTKSHTLAVVVGTPAYAAVALSGQIKRRDLPALVAALRDAAGRIAEPSASSEER